MGQMGHMGPMGQIRTKASFFFHPLSLREIFLTSFFLFVAIHSALLRVLSAALREILCSFFIRVNLWHSFFGDRIAIFPHGRFQKIKIICAGILFPAVNGFRSHRDTGQWEAEE